MKTNKTPSAYQQLSFRLQPLPLDSSPVYDLQAGFCTHSPPTPAASSAQEPHHPSTPTLRSWGEHIQSHQHFWAPVV